MFKKPFAVQGTNLLSKKDVKQLKAQLSDQFPALEEKAIDELLPEGQVKVFKLDNRCLLYSAGDAAPVFFDAEGRGEIYPTLITLWQYPYIMMELTIHPPVSKFVLNGADLMLPGVIVPTNGVAGLGAVTKGQRRCIKIEGNPYPIAVGKMLVNQTQMEKLKGKGLEVAHVFKDTLWEYAGKAIPNAGFSEKEDEITGCSDATWVPGGCAGGATASPSAASPTAAASGASSSAAPDLKVDSPKAAPSSGSPTVVPNLAGAEAGSKATRAPEDWSQDDLLDFCFVQAFSGSITLPVEASDLYEKHMKPRRPEGTTLDVKKSSHKQIGKYLNVMRKAKVLEVTEKKNVVNVTKIDKDHKVFVALVDKFASESDAIAKDSGAGNAGGDAKLSAGLPPPVIKTLWKVTHYLEGLFKTMGKSKSDFYTEDEAKAVLMSYVKKEGLEKDGGIVKLNEELITALLKAAGGQKKDSTFPEEIELSELEEKLQDRMTQHTSIDVAGIGPTVRKGPPAKIEVSLSRKGAHNVTRACNLESYGIDVQAVGDELKKKLNCTVHVEDMPGKNVKDKMLQLQGHVNQELGDYLLDKYGITKAFLSVK
mmetsp:Transcript_30037/g.82445  ORF Transcript_30037/g.82445 Transcript_30037/m.82445 type:complete len:593 (-) Transcript_30037:91-1869(-)